MQKMCEEYIPELQHMPMFYGIDQNEMKSMLTCLGSYIKEYKKEFNYLLDELYENHLNNQNYLYKFYQK